MDFTTLFKTMDIRVSQTVAHLFLLTCLSFLGGVDSKNCVTRDQCSCIFDDGSGMIDLSGIGNKDGTPLFLDNPAASTADEYMYSYNPCYAFQEGTCTNTAVCQYGYYYQLFYDAGAADLATFGYDNTDVSVTYESLDGSRQTIVTLKCDPNQTPPYLEVTGETSPSIYNMKMTGAPLCPVPAPDDQSGGGGGLSAGSVMLIIFFVLLTVYIIGGVVYSKARNDAAGKELIPNRTFWGGLPSLIKDGFAFTTGLICRKKSVYVSLP